MKTFTVEEVKELIKNCCRCTTCLGLGVFNGNICPSCGGKKYETTSGYGAKQLQKFIKEHGEL